MTFAVTREALAGVGPGDHACCIFGSDDEQRVLVGRLGSDAIARGERLVYLAHRSEESSIRSYLDDAGVDTGAGLKSGQIEIRPFDDSDMACGAFDPERQIAALGAEKDRARADGFSALSLIGEMSWAVSRPGDAARIAVYERAVSRIFSDAAVTGVCQYDTRLFPDDLLSRLVDAHDFKIAIGPGWSRVAKGEFAVHERHTGTLVISGEIDIGAEGYLRSRLQEHMFGQTDVVIDVGDLSFIDVSGCRVLIHAARTLPEGRRLVLVNPPSHLVRTLSLCGWVDHPRLVLDAPNAAGISSESGCA